MNIDDKLQALTNSVQALVEMHAHNEQRVERLSRALEGQGKRNTRLEELVTEVAEGTARLLRVAEAHERRISDLEENQPQQ